MIYEHEVEEMPNDRASAITSAILLAGELGNLPADGLSEREVQIFTVAYNIGHGDGYTMGYEDAERDLGYESEDNA
jgi:hypothetical protein